MMNETVRTEEAPAGPRISRRHRRLAKDLRTYLRQNLDRKVTIRELAKHFRVSETLVKSCFKEVYGETLHVWFRHEKMLMADRTLERTSRSVMEIAGSLGFDNASKFAKVFGEDMGMPPALYRRARKEEKARLAESKRAKNFCPEVSES